MKITKIRKIVCLFRRNQQPRFAGRGILAKIPNINIINDKQCVNFMLIKK